MVEGTDVEPTVEIEQVRPSTPSGVWPAKAAVGEPFAISADIFSHGHEVLSAEALIRPQGSSRWRKVRLAALVNDRWEGWTSLDEVGPHEFMIQAGIDTYLTWSKFISAKIDGEAEIGVELEEGARLFESHAEKLPSAIRSKLLDAATSMRDPSEEGPERAKAGLDPKIAAIFEKHPHRPDGTSSKLYHLWVDRERALTSAWYEMFPRSEGGFEGAAKRLRAIADMGFDVVYFPPIHPIGSTHRKGRNNSLKSAKDDPGSPWAIGSALGGHTAIHPELGSLDDFKKVVEEAKSLGMEIALDYALQCSPDHPWVKEHPEWFHHRPDGSIKYAENPPKKYEDIYPINFWPESGQQELWEACRDILDHWIGAGVKIFRVDNPHTKPFAFWAWVIADVQSRSPDVVFLAEAFTEPKVMAKLAEIGFTQSYTYFTWRNAKWELTEYLQEVCLGPKSDFMRPNFWPNTPDILSGSLRDGSPEVFRQRLVLAATMSPSYGIYSGYELFENQPASQTNEEYLNSEKYQITKRDWSAPDSLAPFIAKLNGLRRKHRSLQLLRNISFHWADSDQVIVYSKATVDLSDVTLMVVSLAPDTVQEAMLWLDLASLGITDGTSFEMHDELSGQSFMWTSAAPYVRLEPGSPAHILHLGSAK